MRIWLPATLLLATAGCSAEKQSENLATFDIEEAAAPAAPADRMATAAPQIAYAYTVAYRLGAVQVERVQRGQAALCRSLGPQRCIVMESRIDRGEAGAVTGLTTMLVDARVAPAFGNRLDAVATGADGEVADRSTTAEDVTRQVVDVNARVRAKEALAARLLALINSANGRVADLVAAEKAYADTQEELHAARSLQATLRQRVAMSRFELRYEANESAGALAPVRRALARAGDTFSFSIGALVTVLIAALPWIAVSALLVAVGRRLGWRGPLQRWRERRAARR